jgi:hypothetical protein
MTAPYPVFKPASLPEFQTPMTSSRMETPQSIKNTAQLASVAVHPRSAQRSLVKVESGI